MPESHIQGRLLRVFLALRAIVHYVKLLRHLCSSAAPLFPIVRLTASENNFNWIAAREEYKAWIRDHQPSVLHLYGANNALDASRFIFRCLDEDCMARQRNEIITYFSFGKDDDRCNSTIAMLITLLTQIINECESLYKAMRPLFDEMSHHCSWTATDLLLLFRAILSSHEFDGIFCIINIIGECDGSFLAFMEQISSLARLTERRFKVAVTCTPAHNP